MDYQESIRRAYIQQSWIYLLDIYSILLRITLLLLMYEVVEAMEKKASGYLSEYRSFTNVHIDWTLRNSTQLRIPVSSVVEETEVAKCRLVMTLINSADDRVARAGI